MHLYILLFEECDKQVFAFHWYIMDYIISNVYTYTN